MKLDEASDLPIGDVKFEEILFISDLETFDKEISKQLISTIKKENKKLIVFIGDILSGMNDQIFPMVAYERSYEAMKFIFDRKELEKDGILDSDNYTEIAKTNLGSMLSNYLTAEFGDVQKEFIKFLNKCKKMNVFCIYYSGNHDCKLNYWFLHFDSPYIPFLNKIYKHPSIKFPHDFSLEKLNDDLYLTGTNTMSDEIDVRDKMTQVDSFIERDEGIEHPEKIIFVSHIPGKEKFRNLGSQAITDLKLKYKFKYHYHGHCKNYNGEYKEEGVPTISVHHEEKSTSEQ